MFTGLVESLGAIKGIDSVEKVVRLEISAPQIIEGVEIGDSISINGCCLTVVKIDSSVLSFDAVPETMERTNLGQKKIGDSVNMERSLRIGDRMGGHFVTGHIDGPAKLSDRQDGVDWSTFRFSLDPELTKQMASKGSVAIDGVSLTLVDVDPGTFSVALIPHTLKVTTLGNLAVGDQVNIETDVLAKYVQAAIAHPA